MSMHDLGSSTGPVRDSEDMFFFDLSDRDHVWSPASPEPPAASTGMQVYHVASPLTIPAREQDEITEIPLYLSPPPPPRPYPGITTATVVPSATLVSSPTSYSSPSFSSPSFSFDNDFSANNTNTMSVGPPVPRRTTTEEWQAAAQENAEGVHYTREKFPSDAITFLAATFSREPVEVEEDERVLILDEVSEFALRVKVLRTGVVGVLPAWNVEGALERLARLNMMFNEVATCPKEIAGHAVVTQGGNRDPDATLSSLASHMHVHDRCLSDPRLRISLASSFNFSSSPAAAAHISLFSPASSASSSTAGGSDDEADAELLTTPVTPPQAPALTLAMTHGHGQKRRKSVEFVTSPRRTIFRYVPAPETEMWEESEDDSSPSPERKVPGRGDRAGGTGEEREDEAEDSGWWWSGWEEHEGEDEEADEDVVAHLQEAKQNASQSQNQSQNPPARTGRPRVRRKQQAYLV